MPEPLPTISCPCGFSVSGTDETGSALAHASHLPCSNTRRRAWHESLFSWWGAAIVGASLFGAYLIIEAVNR